MKKTNQIIRMDAYCKKGVSNGADNKQISGFRGKRVSINTKNHASSKEISKKIISFCKD